MPVYPFNIQLGPLQVTGYGIMMMVGFLVGGWLIGLELQRRRLNRDYASDIVFAALIGWMSGLHKQSEVVAQVRGAAELLLP